MTAMPEDFELTPLPWSPISQDYPEDQKGQDDHIATLITLEIDQSKNSVELVELLST